MENSAYIDIIIPVYNTANFIDECLQSIQNQTYKNWRGIIIDDKSTDNSLEICQKWAQKDPRFEIVALDINHGISEVRNISLNLIKAPYFTCIDSDDFVGTDHLSKIVQTIENSNAKIIATGYTTTYLDGSIYKSTQYMKEGTVIYNPELFTLIMMEKISSHMCKFTFSTNLIKENNIHYWEYKAFEDHVILPQIIECTNKMAHTGLVDYYYRVNPEGIVRTTRFDPYKKYLYFLAVCKRRQMTEESSLISSYTKRALKVWFAKNVVNTYKAYVKHIPESEDKQKYLKLMREEMQKYNIKIRTNNLFFYNLWMSIQKRYYEKALWLRFRLNKK